MSVPEMKAGLVDILFIAPAGPPDDHRYFYKQLLVAQASGLKVAFICRDKGVRRELVHGPVCALGARSARLSRLSGGLSLLSRVVSIRPRAIQICSVELLPLGVVARIMGISTFYDCREDMPTSIREHKVEIPKLARVVLAKLVEWMELFAARKFNGVTVSDRWIESKFAGLGCENYLYFPNYPRLEDFPQRPVEKKYDFCVLGSMSPRTGLAEALDALSILHKNGWRGKAVLIGQPSEAVMPRVEAAIKAGVDVVVTGRLPYSSIPGALAECKIGLIPLKNMRKFHRNVATKMFEYSASGNLIVATDLPPQRGFLGDRPFAELIEADSAEALATGMLKMLNSDLVTLGDLARKEFVNSWNIDLFYPALIEYYREGMAK